LIWVRTVPGDASSTTGILAPIASTKSARVNAALSMSAAA
jgi:hypothetical protein